MAAPGQYWHHVPVPSSITTKERGTFCPIAKARVKKQMKESRIVFMWLEYL
jgi:hypothetical protein